MKINKIKTEMVDRIPHELEEGILYICLDCMVAVHLCACGCKEKVITPLDDENGWKLYITTQGVSLEPSIGNFNQPCNTHYFIKNNKIKWC